MPNQTSPLVELRNISQTFRLDSGMGLRVLGGVSFSIYENEVVALLGPSGSGKSTCLRIMSGLLEASGGEVFSRGEALKTVNLDIGLVFQAFALFPWETVFNNIAMALKPLKLPNLEVRSRVKRVIDLVGLEGFEEAYPRELSGGMKQRVGIARALVMERPILCLDEPFTNLDVLTADTLRAEMLELFHDKKTSTRAMVVVSHSIQEAVMMARRILVMGTNPGHIRREILNDLPYPRDDRSPGFRRMVSQIHTQIAEALMPDPGQATSGGPERSTPSVFGSLRAPQVNREPPIETLPNVQIGEVIGLIEAIADQGGVADIFELAHTSGKDFGKTLYLAKAAELLELVDTPKQAVVLTDLGRHFFEGDINVRKRMLHELFGALKIVQMTANLLRKNESLRLPIDELVERVGEWLPAENPHQIVEVLVGWGRFAEFFGYNDDTKELYLDVGQETA